MRPSYALIVLVLLSAAHCEAAQDVGIRSMLVGGRILEVSENRQITLKSDGVVTGAEISPDGRYVVYGVDSNGRLELRLTRVAGGSTVTLMDAPLGYDVPPMPPPPGGETWELDADTDVYWSPDSSRFAFRAIHRAWDGDQIAEKRYIVIFAARGSFLKSIPAPDGSASAMVFGPDSRTLYVGARLAAQDNPEVGSRTHAVGIQSMDTTTGAVHTIYSCDAHDIWILGLCDGGRSLLCTLLSKAGRQLRKVATDGSAEDVAGEPIEPGRCSPDCALAVVSDTGISLRNLATQEKTALITDSHVRFVRWSQESKMLLYRQSEQVTDAADSQRSEQPNSLWLSLTTPSKLNNMCVALDYEGEPSCSRECRRIAYVSQGQLYVAELSMREPTVPEKLAAGLPLTEDETKQVLATNGKQIAMGMLMYSADNDGRLPPADSLAAALQAYLRDKNVFLRPGTQDNAFTYLDPGVSNWSDIERPAETPIGQLDAGYGWVVVIYADGHVRVAPR